GLSPLRVVILIAGNGADQRACVTLRAQAQIDSEKKALRGLASDFGDESFRQAFEKLVIAQSSTGGRGVAWRLLENSSLLRVNENDIHVRAVVQFLAAELA